jgi:hypothetical protein
MANSNMLQGIAGFVGAHVRTSRRVVVSPRVDSAPVMPRSLWQDVSYHTPPQPLMFVSECEKCPHSPETYCPSLKGKCTHGR